MIIGGSAGLGFETALQLARRGYDVTITGRDELKLESAANTIGAQVPGVLVRAISLNLADLSEVEESATAIKSGPRIDLLVANAGAKIESPMKATAQGFEWHMGVNHLGHFALIANLEQHLATDARVVTIASIVARRGDSRGINSASNLALSPGVAYANSKLANLMFALEFNARATAAGLEVSATAAHPGFARASAYGSKFVRFGEYLAAQSARRGSLPLVEAAFAAPGNYLGPRVFELWGSPTQARIPHQAKDDAVLAQFWTESERLTGLTLFS